MSVQRFRDHQSAGDVLPVRPGDPALTRRIRSLWRRSGRLTPPAPVRGILRFGSIEEANEERELRVAARVKRLLALRLRD